MGLTLSKVTSETGGEPSRHVCDVVLVHTTADEYKEMVDYIQAITAKSRELQRHGPKLFYVCETVIELFDWIYSINPRSTLILSDAIN